MAKTDSEMGKISLEFKAKPKKKIQSHLITIFFLSFHLSAKFMSFKQFAKPAFLFHLYFQCYITQF